MTLWLEHNGRSIRIKKNEKRPKVATGGPIFVCNVQFDLDICGCRTKIAYLMQLVVAAAATFSAASSSCSTGNNAKRPVQAALALVEMAGNRNGKQRQWQQYQRHNGRKRVVSFSPRPIFTAALASCRRMDVLRYLPAHATWPAIYTQRDISNATATSARTSQTRGHLLRILLAVNSSISAKQKVLFLY